MSGFMTVLSREWVSKCIFSSFFSKTGELRQYYCLFTFCKSYAYKSLGRGIEILTREKFFFKFYNSIASSILYWEKYTVKKFYCVIWCFLLRGRYQLKSKDSNDLRRTEAKRISDLS